MIGFEPGSEYRNRHGNHWLGVGDGVAWGEPDYAVAECEQLHYFDGHGAVATFNIREHAESADRQACEQWRTGPGVTAEMADTFDRLWVTWEGSGRDLTALVVLVAEGPADRSTSGSS